MRGRNNRKGQNPLTRVYESNGPDVKIRGTASHVAEIYMQLARDSQSSGDPVSAENYYQHAEHYFRLIAAMQEQFRQANPNYRENEQRDSFDDGDDDGQEYSGGAADTPYVPREAQQQPYPQRDQQSYGSREPRFGGGGRDQQSQQPYRYRDRDNRDRDNRDNRDNRDRDNRDRDNRDGNRLPPQSQSPQPQAQPQPPQAPPQPHIAEEPADMGLPAFVTGGQSPVAASNGAAAPQQDGAFPPPSGFDGQPDRFPLHRRRRRRPNGPRPDAPQGAPEAGE
jgi:hypothetical protein